MRETGRDKMAGFLCRLTGRVRQVPSGRRPGMHGPFRPVPDSWSAG